MDMCSKDLQLWLDRAKDFTNKHVFKAPFAISDILNSWEKHMQFMEHAYSLCLDSYTSQEREYTKISRDDLRQIIKLRYMYSWCITMMFRKTEKPKFLNAAGAISLIHSERLLIDAFEKGLFLTELNTAKAAFQKVPSIYAAMSLEYKHVGIAEGQPALETFPDFDKWLFDNV